MARLSLLAPILAIASACAASGEPGEVVVLVRADDGTYRLEPRDLGVRSFRPLASDRFVYVSNASVAFHDTSPVTVTVEDAEPFVLELTDGDPMVPADHEGLVIATAAYALEESYRFYESLGLGRTVPHPASYLVLVNPRYPSAEGFAFTDNAAFAAALHAFLLPPHRYLSAVEVPFVANPSVITHEMGHAMIGHLVIEVQGAGAPLAPNRVEEALNEGLSDVFAIAHVGEPVVFADSLVDPRYAADNAERDVRLDWRYTEALEEQLAAEDYSPYAIGTVVARTFWLHAEASVDAHEGMPGALRAGAQLAFDALRTFDIFAARHPVDFFEHLVAELDPEGADHAAFCAALAITFERALDRVPSCE